MKKLLIAACAVAFGLAANADCTWSWWVGDSKADKDNKGCTLGIATERAAVTGAQIALLWNESKEVKAGAQGAIGFNTTKELRNGAQVAFVNVAENAALQVGLLCFNKKGFLPFFVFFNLNTDMFGGQKRTATK